jgi:riboflavin kinase/FMN adenylyltransferase
MADLIAGSFAYHQRIDQPCVLTIGNFDGVHLGHQRLLTKTIEEARQQGVLSCAYTFEPPPRTLLAPNLQTPRIQSWQDKVETLLSFGLDCVVVEEFSLTFAGYRPDWFAREIIGRRLQASAVVVGYDFRYGKARGGTVDTLRSSLPHLTVYQQDALELQNEVVSSSRIRTLVQNGNVSDASSLLSRPHQIRGIVVSGKQEGRKIGFPTANIFSSDGLIPEYGVYAVHVQVNRGEWKQGMANLGTQPTFGGRQFQIEVHLFDFSGDLYGEELTVAFVQRIRSEKRFESLDQLVAQLQQDRLQCQHVLS